MSSDITFEGPTEDQVAFIRKQMGTNEQDVKEAVTSLRSWLRMQPHLPDALDDIRIEHMYINCKCSMERTKRAMDAYFSLKHKVPELLLDRDPLAPYGKKARRCVKLLVMPRLTPDCHRVMVVTGLDPDASLYHPLSIIKASFMWAEVELHEDLALGHIIVLDVRPATTEHLLKTGINSIRALETTYRLAYCGRIQSIHIISDSKVVDKVLSLARSAIPEKLRDRLMLHQTTSGTLLDHIPAEFLPNDLGGTGGSAEEIEDATYRKVLSYRQWFLEQDRFVSDDSKRPTSSPRFDDIFGVDGSFKRLAVD